MERAEKVGLGLAAAGHVVLFGLLSVGFLATPNPAKLKTQPVEVSLVEEVALESAAPAPAAEPAESVAPEQGPPEDAAPPAETPPEPAPPKPRPAPAPPAPAAKPQPAPPKPAPAPAPKAVPKPPQPRPAAQPKAAPARPTAQPKAIARPAPPKQASAAAKKGTGSTQVAAATRPRGSRLGDDFLKGLSAEPSRSINPNPPAATMSAAAAADINSAIRRQVQPCANRNVSPGPGAGRIVVPISLRLNRDGSLAGTPTVKRDGIRGVDDDNRRYVERVEDLAIAAFVNCAPLRGLPPELYDVPRGWRNFTLNYKLPG
jgi:outer membrane biosynthesis protein TonB